MPVKEEKISFKRKAEEMTELDSQQPSKKKRNRKAVSCINCRRKKVKCDRTFPCSSCKVRGETCEWAENTKPVAESELGVHDLACEIGRLHRIVKELCQKLGMDGSQVKTILAPSVAVVSTLCPPSRRMSSSIATSLSFKSTLNSNTGSASRTTCSSSSSADEAESSSSPPSSYSSSEKPSGLLIKQEYHHRPCNLEEQLDDEEDAEGEGEGEMEMGMDHHIHHHQPQFEHFDLSSSSDDDSKFSLPLPLHQVPLHLPLSLSLDLPSENSVGAIPSTTSSLAALQASILAHQHQHSHHHHSLLQRPSTADHVLHAQLLQLTQQQAQALSHLFYNFPHHSGHVSVGHSPSMTTNSSTSPSFFPACSSSTPVAHPAVRLTESDFDALRASSVASSVGLGVSMSSSSSGPTSSSLSSLPQLSNESNHKNHPRNTLTTISETPALSFQDISDFHFLSSISSNSPSALSTSTSSSSPPSTASSSVSFARHQQHFNPLISSTSLNAL